ncbi:hypothetical protein Smp_087310 [Schistosoma mansoni]|uniref:hypothetical protein n=1 Tax=Schistosoma mansoni TaxID=6183 RepID=UPI00019B34A5|nr:hypothetical protein Smp_087310 [Schistosoma mansoni]|eukprot:XP_018652164.1 hypothetical protein Smp_087310 [Schistosoma mansoni]
MSRNRIRNLSPIQRKLLTKRCQSTFKLLSGLNKNIRKRTCLKRLNGNSSLKPHQIECERLKEILPTVANCENLDEVKIIQEAIKHINYLEQAVLQRLNIINVETPIENIFCESHGSIIKATKLMKTYGQVEENYFPQVAISSVPDIIAIVMVAIYFTDHLKH